MNGSRIGSSGLLVGENGRAMMDLIECDLILRCLDKDTVCRLSGTSDKGAKPELQ
jgi:hypothetical protein